MKFKGIFFGILLIFIGFSLIYFLGYKDSNFFGIISYLAFFIGWIALTFSIIGKYYSFSKPHFLANKRLWISKTLKNASIIIFAVIGVFASIYITGEITEKRFEKILYTKQNDETIGEVINLESRYTRGGWKIWAIFQYETSKNQTFQKGIFNDGNKHKKGDKYYILYSVEYPEIMELEDKVE